jgi:CheY-like chemotaxis protein
MTSTPLPADRARWSILAAEDDPVLGCFLVDALEGLGHRVTLVTRLDEALAAARRERFDLLLVDLELADGDGRALVAGLRASLDAPSREAPAVAMSGELPPPRRAALLAEGFAEAWQKPVSLAMLRGLVGADRAREPAEGPAAAPDAGTVLDDAAALARLGTEATVRALRGLLVRELPSQWHAVRDAIRLGDPARALATLHRTRGGCALCGAVAAADALAAVETALRAGPVPEAVLRRAEDAIARTLAALDASAAES